MVTAPAITVATAPPGATIPIVKPVVVPPSATPTSVVRGYWGDIGEQIVRDETHIFEQAAVVGFHMLPMSDFLSWIVSDQMIVDYVDKALSVVEGAMRGQELDVDVHSNVIAAGINMLTKDFPSLATKFAPKLQGWFIAGLAKVGIVVKAT